MVMTMMTTMMMMIMIMTMMTTMMMMTMMMMMTTHFHWDHWIISVGYFPFDNHFHSDIPV